MQAKDGVRAEILARQMDTLYKAAPASVLSIVGASMALAVYWAPGVRIPLLAWFAAVSGVALLHILVALMRRAGRPRGHTPEHWARIACLIYLASGSAWGLGGAWMIATGNEYQALFMCCLVMGAVTVTFPAIVYLRVYNLFQVPIFVPASLGLAFSDVHFSLLLAAAAIMLSACMAAIAQGMSAQLVDGMRLSLENEALVKRLEERGTQLETANRELEIQSDTDPLTGVANRRHLMRFLRGLDGRAALLIVDVDHFKQYNDSFGHLEGDACLALVAATLQRSIRHGVDLVARQGGEEFAVVLADAGRDEAARIATEICANVRTLVETAPRRIRRTVTVSIGLACRNADERKTIATIVQEADAALYRAKREGRDRVATQAPGGADGIAAA